MRSLEISAAIIVSSIAGFISSYLVTPVIARISIKKELVGFDAHKNVGKPIPSIGGLASVIGLTIAVVLSILLIKNIWYTRIAITCLVVVWISCLIGLIDDIYRLEGIHKVALTLIPGFIILASKTYIPLLHIPFVGVVRLTIVYPILILLGVAVASNAVNMIDTLNGLAPSVVIILLSDILIGIAIRVGWLSPFKWESALLCILSISALLGYLPYNLYPSRVFNGDTGSLAWGALIAYLAIVSKTEVFIIMAAMPMITNGFSILASIKGFIEHGKIRERPVVVDKERNIIYANKNPKAPVTLVQLVTLKMGLREDEVVFTIILLIVLSSLLAVIFYKLII